MASKSGSVIRAAVSRCPRQAQIVPKESLHATSSIETTATATAHSAVSISTELNQQHIDTINTTSATKDMSQLPGPPGWPVIGNFLTYLKKENKGKIHHVQVCHLFFIKYIL